MENTKKKILIIDDDEDCLASAATVLADAGYEVITAPDGQSGLARAVSEQADLIILDVMMPKQDGWDTCDELRALKETHDVPIVFLTCMQPPSSLYASHGAFDTVWDDYLTKPVTPKTLVSTVEKLLHESSLSH